MRAGGPVHNVAEHPRSSRAPSQRRGHHPMSTTTTTAPVAVSDPPLIPAPAAGPERADLGSMQVVHTRHWFRWTLSAILIFVIAQFVWSLVTNANYEWDVFASYFFSQPVLIGIGYTLSLTAIAASIGFALGTVLALG